MIIIRTISNALLFLIGIQSACLASFLVPAKFPKTIADIDFISKMKLKADGYDRYATLSPYEQLILEKADEDIERQIIQDLEQIAQPQSPNVSTPPHDAPLANTPTQPKEEYCQIKQPGIPANQKIPFGSPVLQEHFIYCSPYANLNRGSGLRPHTGYDIGCTLESFDRPIFTPADGIVKLVKSNQTGKSAGNYVIVDHGNGFRTWYLHLNKILVTQGQQVSAGCQIATIGNTGGSLESVGRNDTDPHFRKSLSHLHYEIRYTGSLTSVTTETTGKKVLITHGWAGNDSIDPTQFICVYDNFTHGYCGKTFPYQ